MYMCAASKRVTLLKISRAARHSLFIGLPGWRCKNTYAIHFRRKVRNCFIIHNFDDGNASGEGMEASLVYTHP